MSLLSIFHIFVISQMKRILEAGSSHELTLGESPR